MTVALTRVLSLSGSVGKADPLMFLNTTVQPSAVVEPVLIQAVTFPAHRNDECTCTNPPVGAAGGDDSQVTSTSAVASAGKMPGGKKPLASSTAMADVDTISWSRIWLMAPQSTPTWSFTLSPMIRSPPSTIGRCKTSGSSSAMTPTRGDSPAPDHL